MKTRIITSRRRAKSVEPLKKATIQGMQRLFKDAIEVYIRVAIDNISMDSKEASGMTASSLLPVAARIRKATAMRALIGGQFTHRIYDSTAYPGVLETKSKKHGELLGKRAYEYKLGSVSDPKFVFQFEIVVLQHAIHEGEWQSLNLAAEAMKNYIITNGSDYVPSVSNWLLNRRLISRK